MESQNDYISHHGVPGMKWGQRKSRYALVNRARSTVNAVKDASLRIRETRIRKTNAKVRKQNAIARVKNKEAKAKLLKDTESQTPVKTEMSSKEARKLSAKREKNWEKIYLSRSRLTNEELNKAIKRLELENKMSQQVKTAAELTKPEATKAQKAIQRARTTTATLTMISPVVVNAIPKLRDNPKSKSYLEAMNTLNKLLNK